MNSAPISLIILEDEASHVSAILRSFEQVDSSAEIRVARCLREYCEQVAERPPDIALLDLNLPDGNNMEALSLLSEANPFPVLVMTSCGNETVAVAAMKAGALDYLVKSPETFSNMPRAVDRVLREWGLIQASKKAEAAREALRMREARLLSITEAAHDAIFRLNACGEISYWNPAAQMLFGYSKEEAIGKTLYQLLVPECFRAAHHEPGHALRRIGSERPIGQSIELTTHHKDGHAIAIAVSLWTVAVDSDWNTVGIVRDLSDLKRLETEILSISDREQHRIGQDLHDGLGQQLTALEMKCFLLLNDLSAKDLAGNREALQSQVQQISLSLQECVRTTRALSYSLAPVQMAEDGLINALSQLAHRVQTPGKLECQFVSTAAVSLNTQTASHLFRIAQEAVNNAVKHAQTKRIEIRLEHEHGVLRLQIKDYGQGMPEQKGHSQGMGMHGMRYRAALIGALLDIDSKPGEGVTCCVSLKMSTPET